MNPAIRKNVVHLAYVASMFSAVVFACSSAVSQQATPSSPQAKVSIGTETSRANPLDGDPRLKRPLTLRRDNITIERALAEISDFTGVHCVAEHIKLSNDLALHFPFLEGLLSKMHYGWHCSPWTV